MIYIKVLFLIALLINITGCAQKILMEDMTVSNIAQKNYDTKFKSAVKVSNVFGGKETNPLIKPNINDEEFKRAVIASLINAGLYSENGDYRLKIEIMNVGEPLFGLDMTVTMTIRYILSNSTDNSIIFDKIINKSYTATFSDSALGMKRFMLAKEGSAKANISALLEEFTISDDAVIAEEIRKDKEDSVFKVISED